MNINEFRYDILIQEAVKTKDSYGAENVTYTALFTLKAAKKPAGGSKGIDSAEIFTSNNLIFEIHYRNITEDMIVVYEGNKYRINQIVEVGFRAGMQLFVEKINE